MLWRSIPPAQQLRNAATLTVNPITVAHLLAPTQVSKLTAGKPRLSPRGSERYAATDLPMAKERARSRRSHRRTYSSQSTILSDAGLRVVITNPSAQATSNAATLTVISRLTTSGAPPLQTNPSPRSPTSPLHRFSAPDCPQPMKMASTGPAYTATANP